MGRFARIDGRKSLNYSKAVIILVVVSACLIGTLITISALVDSAKNFEISDSLTSNVKLLELSKNKTYVVEDDSSYLLKKTLKDSVKHTGGTDESHWKPQGKRNTLEEFETLAQEDMLEKARYDDDDDMGNDSGNKEVVKFTNGEDTKPRYIEENPMSDTRGVKPTAKDQLESEEIIDASKLETKDVEDKSKVEASYDVTKEEVHEIKDEANFQSLEAVSVSVDDGMAAVESLTKSVSNNVKRYIWKLCNVTAGPDYIPCLDNIQAIRKLPSTSHYEHRERHCPDQAPTCLVSLPEGYRSSVPWPKSRERIWFANVPHVTLVEFKGHQNWVQLSGTYITFPGGGTQFKNGATHYIDFIQKTVPAISWGKKSRVILDVGCGVASFGGYLFDREVLTMSLAPKDKHEAQVQFALERGIPAISAVLGTKKLPFPSMAFDVVHCARCRVPWHIEGGKLLLELDRVLRPGGYFVWSATPVYRKDPEDVSIWKAMSKLTKSMCWELLRIGKDKVNGVSAAIYRKPTFSYCYRSRSKNDPSLCQDSDEPNATWNIPLGVCIQKVTTDPSERGYHWPAKWPSRLEKPPYWLKPSEVGVYGMTSPNDFIDDFKHRKGGVGKSYLNGIGVDWSSVRNVMDMNAKFGGFASALKDLKLWVMNVVPIDSPDTLEIIYERGLLGIYHNWCESFSTYPRTYDLLHADKLFSYLKKRCKFVAIMAEVDRILRPGGNLIVRDDAETITEVESMAKSLKWKIQFIFSKENEGLLCVQKTKWRPEDVETVSFAIA